MSSKYYYFISSLPTLSFGSKPPLTVKKFLEDCENLLSEEDYGDILKAFQDNVEDLQAGNATLKKWQHFIKSFRTEAVWSRVSHVEHKNPLDYIRGGRTSNSLIVYFLAEAAKAPDPLSAEKILDEAKWNYLDEISIHHYFDFDLLVIYALKLKILARYQKIESSAGEAIFKKYKKEALQLD